MTEKILFVYPPFATPASPPYSLCRFMGNKYSCNVEALDLNLEFHKRKFNSFYDYCVSGDFLDYELTASKFRMDANSVYSSEDSKVISGKEPEFLDEMIKLILEKKPTIVAFSIVYSSQVFYAYAIMKKLSGIDFFCGGPATSFKLEEVSTVLNSQEDFTQILKSKYAIDVDLNDLVDYSWIKEKYFNSSLVLPVKLSDSCYYQGCTFCTHHGSKQYKSFNITKVVESVKSVKYLFLVDDMISKPKLLKFASSLKGVYWMCQLKPSADWDLETLKKLYSYGLRVIIWGVESGNDRVLGLMNKGTNVKDVSRVLHNSALAGIKNVAYIMFGFPTETLEEFNSTIEFLKNNPISLVSTSVFGLQKGSYVYSNYSSFGISSISEERRTFLDPKITYKVSKGLSNNQVRKLRTRNMPVILGVNKYPKSMNYFREHMLVFVCKNNSEDI